MNDELFRAIELGDVESVRAAVSGAADVNATDEAGVPAVLRAILKGDSAVLSCLIETGAEVAIAADPYESEFEEVWGALPEGLQGDADLSEGFSALGLAVALGDLDCVRLLLDASRNKALVLEGVHDDLILDPPLVLAARRGYLEILELLLEAGANPKVFTSEGPLMAAAGRGDLMAVKRLLGAGAEVEEANEDGFRPVIEASAGGHLDVVRTLTEHGADISHVDGGGRSAIEVAEAAGHLRVVEFLRERIAK